MLTPREKSPLPEKISPEEALTHDTASSRAESPTHYQQVILAVLHQAGQRAQHTTNKLFWPSCIKQGREPNTLPTSYFGRPASSRAESPTHYQQVILAVQKHSYLKSVKADAALCVCAGLSQRGGVPLP